MAYKILSEDLIEILVTVVKNNIYGSVEIFFEKGKVTQITQRIIKKVAHPEGNNGNKQSMLLHSNHNVNKKQPMNDPYILD